MRDMRRMSRGGGCLGIKEAQSITMYVQLGLNTIKGLVVYNSWDLEPFDLLNGLFRSGVIKISNFIKYFLFEL